MSLEILGISVLWTFLFGYILIGAIDFGAGFFNAYSLLTGKKRILTNIIQRYLSPVWEVTNVFLVFFFVGIIGFFPKTAFYYGTTLLVPVSIGIILLAIRGSYYAFETYGSRGHKGYSFMYGLAGLLLPASLSIVLTISEGGFVEMVDGNPVLDYWLLFTSPLTWSIVVLSIAATLYISAVFLTWYANKARDLEATNLLRKYALIWALPTIITAGGIIFELRNHNPEHYSNIQNFWPMFLISFIMFIGLFGYYGNVEIMGSRSSSGRAIHICLLRYGASHYPYLLYPYLTIYDSFTNPAMAISLIVVFIMGLCLLIPSLYLLMRLFLFDKDYVRGKSKHHVKGGI